MLPSKYVSCKFINYLSRWIPAFARMTIPGLPRHFVPRNDDLAGDFAGTSFADNVHLDGAWEGHSVPDFIPNGLSQDN